MKLQLIDNWWDQFKHRLSVKLAALNGVALTVLLPNWSIISGMMQSMPPHMRWIVGGFVGFASFAIPVVTSLVAQPKLATLIQEKQDGGQA